MIRHARLPQVIGPVWRFSGSARRPSNSSDVSLRNANSQLCCIHTDGRTRLSHIWMPLPTVQVKDVGLNEETHDKLLRAGFLRQAHSGLFHMLHFGHRVEEKLSALIEKHMKAIGASKVSLSTISSEKLWRKSGRFENVASELYTFNDRKGTQRFILSPTHEEEITSLVANGQRSYKNLPIKLYQITRKYRDEFRPRQGLLRAREFLMKDLYSFDLSIKGALETYGQVRGAYDKIFADLRLPVLVAAASSGSMGGNLSHEYHLQTPIGDDHVVNCTSCGYVANSEVVHPHTARKAAQASKLQVMGTSVWRGISKDRQRLYNVWYPSKVIDESGKETAFKPADINFESIKALVPDVETAQATPTKEWRAILESAETRWEQPKFQLINFIDYRLSPTVIDELPAEKQHLLWPYPGERVRVEEALIQQTITTTDLSGGGGGEPLDFIRTQTGDPCPQCDDGTVSVSKAIELGHTFYLGTRYSEPLGAHVELPSRLSHLVDPSQLKPNANSAGEATAVGKGKKTLAIPLQMGCYGIGVSRIIGAVADHLSDAKGLNWPRAIAPYEVAVVRHDLEEVGNQVYDCLAAVTGSDGKQIDVLLDDREESMGWKLNDADLVGYPVVVIVGGAWKEHGLCEVRCRLLHIEEKVSLEKLPMFVANLLEQL